MQISENDFADTKEQIKARKKTQQNYVDLPIFVQYKENNKNTIHVTYSCICLIMIYCWIP